MNITCELCKTFRQPTGDSKNCFIPLISDSTFFGPSLDETIIYLISFLPKKLLKRLGFFHENENMKGGSIDLDRWLKAEYMALAKEVANCGLNSSESCGRMNSKMLESRRFVLNRLAELMEKKAELERCLNQCSMDD